MSGRTDSDTQDDIRADAMDDQETGGPTPRVPETDGHPGTGRRTEAARRRGADGHPEADAPPEPDQHPETDEEDGTEDARRARWTATGTGALLTLAGLAAALMRLGGSAPALVPAAYALGAAVCALAAVLGSRGRTRRSLWLLIAGVMIMAVGDQSD
ncbi:hypothetical protein ACH4F6_35415 [Streptomyces sp. NPDC017936]|uniref:hypothetical protein n=1 Tax=Streptomyces sp. NPDC017936 TaxID=3365016 RepID=UPI0037A470D4